MIQSIIFYSKNRQEQQHMNPPMGPKRFCSKIAPAAKVGSTPLLGAVQAGHAAVASRWNAEVLPGMMQACWNE